MANSGVRVYKRLSGASGVRETRFGPEAGKLTPVDPMVAVMRGYRSTTDSKMLSAKPVDMKLYPSQEEVVTL